MVAGDEFVIKNAITNGILCYISTARQLYSDNVLLSTCPSFYNHDAVADAKKLLFNVSGGTPVQRRGDDRTKTELKDILLQFRLMDDNETILPKFVADSRSSMPPGSGYEVISEHIVTLITEIGNLKQDIVQLKDAVGSSDDNRGIADLKKDFHEVKVLLKKVNTIPNLPTVATSVASDSKENVPLTADKPTTSNQRRKRGYRQSGSAHHLAAESGAGPVVKITPPSITATIDTGVDSSKASVDSDCNLVQRKGRRRMIRGQKKSLGTFRGVKGTLDVYIGRCDMSVDANILKKYIQDEIGLNSVNCECLSNDRAQ